MGKSTQCIYCFL